MSVPGAPNIYIRPRALTDSIFLYWRPPLSIGGSPIISYNVTCPEASYDQTFGASINRITVSSLTSGIDYTFQITATNSQGTGPAATYRTVQVGLSPGGAQNVNASTATSTSAMVNWSFSTNTGEAPTKWFVLSAIPTLAGPPIVKRSANGDERQREFFNLSTNTSYRILVQAVSDVRYAPPTALSEIITMGPGGPTEAFKPDTIPGLLFWGDMSLLTGASVTSIPNLGNYNNPNVSLTGSGTVTTGTLNGLNVLSLNTSQNFTGTNLSLPNWTLFTVARKNSQDGYIFTDGGNNTYGYWGQSKATFNLQEEGVNISPQAGIPNTDPTWDIQTLTKWNDSNGLNVKFNWNGTTVLEGTSATYTNKNILLTNISINTQPSFTSTCDVAEILIFESSLSQEDIQAVEGYLANKWGLKSNLPSSHPYKESAPQSTTPLYWNPTLLNGCQLWLDAADESSVLIGNDSFVNTWLDKSGNTHNAVAYNSPQYANQKMQFNGAQYFSSDYTTGSASETAFVVINFNTLEGEQDILSWDASVGVRGREYMLYGNNITLVNSSGIFAQNGGTPVVGATTILAYDFTSSSCNFFTNGALTGENLGNYSNSATGPTIIGSYGPTGAFLNGDISEIIIYNRTLSPSERQVTEGYLAWKWGLQGSLQQNHPFAYNAPAPEQPIIFNPLSVPGCQLWLDGKDQTTVIKSNTTVTQWIDKSGLNNSTTNVIGAPTHDLSGVIFDGSSYFTLPNNTIPYNDSSYSVYCVANFTASGAYGILGAGAAATNSTLSVRSNYEQMYTYWYDNDIITSASFTLGSSVLYDTLYESGGKRSVFLFGSPSGTDTPAGVRVQPNSSNRIGSDIVSSFMLGTISEVLVYNKHHTKEEREAIEGYLAWKWAIQSQLPANHSYYNIPPATNMPTSWSPKNINNLGLWLDGMDISAAAAAAGAPVVEWLDKSQNQCKALSPTNSPLVAPGGGVVFDGTQQMSFDTFPQIKSTTTCFFVTSPCTTNQAYLYASGNVSGIILNFSAQFQQFASASNDGTFVTSGANPVSLYSYTRIVNTSNVGYYMGSEVFNYNSITTAPIASLSSLGSGGDVNFFGGTIYEIIFYDKALSTAERQVVEGYLAWKWSIQSQLPNSHPFYDEPPTPNEPTSWRPTKLHGLNLWLDGADQSSTLISNSNLLTILDKSGKQNNMTNKNGVVGIDTTTFNGLSALSLNNTYFLGSLNPPITTPEITAFSVATLNSASTGAGRILSLGRPGVPDWQSNDVCAPIIRNTNLNIINDRNNIYPTTTIPAYDTPFLAYASNIQDSNLLGINGLTPITQITNIADNFNITQYGIGTNTQTADIGSYYTGKIAEIIVTNTSLNQSLRQVTEGYLAWKWGIQSTLPSIHPYYNEPPSPYVSFPVTQLVLSSNSDDTGTESQLVTQAGNVTFAKITDNTCAVFDNSVNTYISVPFSPSQNFTIAYWFNVLDTGYYNPWSLSDSPTGTGTYGINPDLADGLQYFFMNFSGGNVNAGGWTYPSTSGNWYHVALSVNQETGVCSSYLNGVHKTTVQASGTLLCNNYLILGKDGTSARAYNGYLSQFCVFDQALSANEVQWTYQNITPLLKQNVTLLLLKATNYSGSGAWLDESEQSNDATLQAGTITKNAQGNGIVLDGATGWTLPNVAAAEAWTVGVWFKSNMTGNNGSSIITQDGSSNCGIVAAETGFAGAFNPGDNWRVGTVVNFVQNVWTNMQVSWDGTNMTTYLNGVSVGTNQLAGPSTDSNAAYYIGRRGASGTFITGEIGEIRIYNYARNQTQVQSDYQSSYNTFFMNPTQITGCQLWLDGADQSSLTLSGVNVTVWSDKSGNSHDAISFSTPTYNNNSITIAPGNSIKAPIPAQTFINAFQAFVVYKSLGASAATNDAVITRGNSTSNPNLANPLDMQASEFFIGQTNEVYIKNDYNCYNTNKSVFNLNINQVTQETESFSTFSNGLQAAGQYLSRGPPGTWTKSDDGDTVVIGGRVDNARSMHGIYYEVLIYNRVLSPNERQMVEGYLAWKWQLQSQLPALHPFLNGPPVYNQQLPPLKLMLKAITYNGTGAWLDESGNNANATLEQGLISINADNNGVVLNGATSWSFPNVAVGSSWTVNVWFKQTGPSVYNVGNYPFAHLITQMYNNTNSANLTIGETDLAATFSGGILYGLSWFRGNNITLQQNAWTNIQVTYDGTNMVTYVDGVLLGSVALATTSINNGGAYLIGRRWDGNCFMVGEVGEIRIYNYAINQTKVTADHNESVANFPKPPLVLLNASTYSGSGTWNDSSGNGKNATLEVGVIAKNAEGNGVILNGSTSWTFPALNIGNAWTVNVWFKRTADFSSIDAACIISQIFEGDGMNIYIGNTYGFLNCGFVTSSAAWALGSQITLTNNVWTNIQATWDGASIKTYINGVLIGTATSSAVDNNSGLGYRIGGSINGDKYVTGIIGEIRMYGYALTQAQVTRDYNESVATFPYPFVPIAITGCQIWFDGADQSSMTKSGSTVTQWNDKSGNNNHGIGNGGLTFSNNTIVYDGTTGFFSTPYPANSTIETGFVVFNMTNENSFILGGRGVGVRCFMYNQSVGMLIGNFGQTPLGTNSPINTNTTYLVSYNYNSSGAYINVNGTQLISGTGNYSPYSNTETYIGGWSNGPGNHQAYIKGAISEIIVYNSNKTTNDVQKVEGYLAWKWSLQSLLPSNHPYKNSAP